MEVKIVLKGDLLLIVGIIKFRVSSEGFDEHLVVPVSVSINFCYLV